MNLSIDKSFLKYIMVLFIYLAPSRMANAYLPYSSYVFYILQLAIGLYFINKYGLWIKTTFGYVFSLFLLSCSFGIFINSEIEVLTLIRYVCWVISLLGLFSFFISNDEEEIHQFLSASKWLFIFTVIISWAYWFIIDESTTKIIVFFWGSEAVTTHSMITFLTLALFFDIKYKDKITVTTIICGILSMLFCIINNSGQGMSMIGVFTALMILEYFTKNKVSSAFRPLPVIIVIAVLYYIVITLKYQNIAIIVRYITDVLSKDVTLTGREQIFTEVLKLFAKHPIVGYGYNNSAVSDALTSIVAQYNTAHNSILQMMIDYGVLGVGLFVGAVYVVFSLLQKSKNKEYIVLYFSLIAMFIGGLVNLIIPTNYFFMVFFLALSAWEPDERCIQIYE